MDTGPESISIMLGLRTAIGRCAEHLATCLAIAPLGFSHSTDVHAAFATSWPIDNSVFARKQDDLHWSSDYVLVNAALLASVLVYRWNVVSIVGVT